MIEEDGVWGWDGRRLERTALAGRPRAGHVERVVGVELAAAIADRGHPRMVRADRLLPRDDVRPAVLLRVPAPVEARRREDAPVGDRPPLDRPLFALDARGAFADVSLLPRETDRAVAGAVLARVEHGMYVPGDAGVRDWTIGPRRIRTSRCFCEVVPC